MKIVKLHYEKLTFVLALLLICLVAFFAYFISNNENRNSSNFQSASFNIDESGNEQTLSLVKKSQIVPGDTIKIFNTVSKNYETYTVVKVIFAKKIKVLIQLKSDEIIEGRLLNSTNTILSKDWQNIRSPIAIETKKGIKNINFNEIQFIRGEQKLVLDKLIKNIDPSEYAVSVYQSKTNQLADANRTEKVRWINSSAEKNASIYDLFTPPIIYLVNGELTTSLPEPPKVVEKKEEFGLKLLSFEQKAFRLKLVSWIGATPYFEDLEKKVSEKSNANVKNRLEVKIPYKENENFRPGAPSLIKSTLEDENKLLMVEYFTVQQIKDPKTGGVKSVGRALIRDFQKGGDPFEVNSLMEKAYSGDFKILLKFEVAGELTAETEITDTDTNKELKFGTRTFKILEINSDKQTILVEKSILGVSEGPAVLLQLIQ